MQRPFWTKTWLMVAIALVALALAATPVLAIEAPPQKDSTVAPAQQVQQEPAAPESGNQLQSSTLLQDWFGVDLELTNTLSGGNNNWSFVLDSFAPTRRLETVNWTQADWYGSWNTSDFNQTTVRGAAPSGGEWYDVEALYFDNDEENIYIVVVTSFPFEGRDLAGNTYSDVGVKDTRISSGIWVRPGDLSLDLGINTAEYGWHYDFGVNLAQEQRPDSGNIQYMRSNDLGNTLYKTTNTAWYIGHPNNDPSSPDGEKTNFDPVYNPSLVQTLGATIVNYYKLPFYNNGVEVKENGADTWVIEVTLPRASLAYTGRPDGPIDGDEVSVRWAPSCRNDADNTHGVIELTGIVRLGLTKSVSPTLFQVPATGSTAPLIATYTFIVSNPKATSLTNVTLVDEFTAFYAGTPILCLEFESVTASREGVTFISNIPLHANLGTLAPGEEVIITLQVDVTGCGLGTLPNTAVADSTETDPVSDDASIIIEAQPAAVELARFEAAAQAEGILLEWETASELDNLGFNLYRSTALNGDYVQLNAALIPAQNPGAVFGGVYTWMDEDVTPGVTYFYKLEDVDIYGVATLHGPVQATALAAGPSAVRIASFSAGGAGWTLPAALSALALLSLKRRRK